MQQVSKYYTSDSRLYTYSIRTLLFLSFCYAPKRPKDLAPFSYIYPTETLFNDFYRLFVAGFF